MGQPIDVASVEIRYDTSRSLAQLRSTVDSALRSIARDFDVAFDSIERAVAGAGGDMGREISQGGEVAEGAIREVERQAKTSFDRVSREATQAGNTIATKLGGAIKGLVAAGALAAAGAGLGFLALQGLKTAASLEQTEVAFSSLLGSVEKGQEVLDGLKSFAISTPFELTEITGAAQRFLAFNDAIGIGDDQLEKFLTTLGNIASVTGAGAEGVDRVTLALGQIASRGTVSLEDLQQIQEALPGFSAVAVIAAQTGMTTAETLDAISAGAISAEDGVAALLAGMEKFPGAAGAMEAQSKTLLGVFSSFKDTFNQSLATAFEPIIPTLKDTLTEVTPIIGGALEILAPAIGDTLIGLLDALAPAIEPLAAIIASTLGALTPFLPIVSAIVVALLDGLVPVFEELEPVVADLAPPLLDLVVALLPLVPALSEILVAVVTVLAPLLQLVAIIVSFLSQKAITPLVFLLAEGLGFLAESVRQFGVWLTQIDWGAVLSAIGGFFSDLLDTIVGWYNAVTGFIQSLPPMAQKAFADFLIAAKDRLFALVDYVRGLPGRVVAALGNFGRLLVDKGRDLIRGLWDGIKGMAGWLWSQINGFVDRYITGAVKSALGISSPSTVMAEEVGAQIPPGIEMGISASVPSLSALMDSLISPVSSHSETAATGAITLGPGSVVINFVGVVPTEGQAMAAGTAAGNGVLRALNRRDTSAAARMK